MASQPTSFAFLQDDELLVQVARFLSKVTVPLGKNVCWLWTAAESKPGRGVFQRPRCKVEGAARVSYRLFRGEIPAGHEIDHLCQVPACVNPAHLQVVTRQQHVAISVSRRTHCKYGHPLVVGNLYVWLEGGQQRRSCATCARAKSRDHQRRKRVVLKGAVPNHERKIG